MLGLWTIIPPSLQDQILSELHKAHPGVARMKAAACSHMVAWNREKHLGESTQVQTALQNQKGSTNSTTFPLVMAYSSMAVHALRLFHPPV